MNPRGRASFPGTELKQLTKRIGTKLHVDKSSPHFSARGCALFNFTFPVRRRSRAPIWQSVGPYWHPAPARLLCPKRVAGVGIEIRKFEIKIIFAGGGACAWHTQKIRKPGCPLFFPRNFHSRNRRLIEALTKATVSRISLCGRFSVFRSGWVFFWCSAAGVLSFTVLLGNFRNPVLPGV